MSASSAPGRTGGCLCGAVRYEVTGALRAIVMCHCTQCRRITGHQMAATAARHRDFRLLSQDALRWYCSSPEAQRGFCAQCGSTLFWQGAGRDYISIAAGTLDDSSGLKIACHIFTADKGGYYEISDAAPQLRDGSFSVPWP
ncbi:MAG: GFA family protein [Gammaproteobacteria bacterium]|nr:GFA family protein [Gammaproteobacteria bacterium]MBV9725287.1 GFA family protein [Gammaproteobacteria bacterium]